MRQRLFKGDHEDVAWSLHKLAKCRSALGRHDSALKMVEDADAMAKRVLKDGHADRLKIAEILATIRAAAEAAAKAPAPSAAKRL